MQRLRVMYVRDLQLSRDSSIEEFFHWRESVETNFRIIETIRAQVNRCTYTVAADITLACLLLARQLSTSKSS